MVARSQTFNHETRYGIVSFPDPSHGGSGNETRYGSLPMHFSPISSDLSSWLRGLQPATGSRSGAGHTEAWR